LIIGKRVILLGLFLNKTPIEDLSPTNADLLYSIYSSLGTTYMYLGNYELAELNYLRSIKLVNTSQVFKDNIDAYLKSINKSMAQLYTRMEKYEKADHLYMNNLNWNKKNYKVDKRYKNNLINAYQKITLSAIAQDSLEKAHFYLEESLPYLLSEDTSYNDALLLYGDIYTGLNEHDKALDIYKKALPIFRDFRENKPHQDIANVQGKIAESYLKQKKYQEGLNSIQKAFNAAGKNINIGTIQENPKPESVFSKIQLLQLLDIKLQLLEESKRGDKEASLATLYDLLETFSQLKGEFESKLDKQFLAKKVYPIFENMMRVVHSIYQEKPSKEVLNLALNISEKNKDFLLLEALRGAQASKYANVPERILDKEAQLRIKISHLEKEIFNDPANDKGYSDNLFEIKQEYFSFLDSLKIKYPKYHSLKYQNRDLDLAVIRNTVLEDNNALISYTMSQDYLYAIVVDESNEKFVKLPFTKQDSEETRNFYRILSKPTIKNGQSEIVDLGKKLYASILKEVLEGFETDNLTIIPDGELHYLPFDLLQNNNQYILETKNISYANSISSLLELTEKKTVNNNAVLAFAPSFGISNNSTDEREFGRLRYNNDEVKKIGTFFNTELVLDEKANLSSFKKQLAHFNVLHLATHASANDQFPDYSYLAFTKEKDSANLFYVKDLYNTQINADLVTLSACQTGIGRLQKGQGMMSLSKGFYYAGAKSLVTTLWKINDKSTVSLMEYFYEALSKGKTKSEALREAKLQYLANQDDPLLKHPYYWAAFTVSGNNSAIVKNNTVWWVCGSVTIALLVLIFMGNQRKKRKRKRLAA